MFRRLTNSLDSRGVFTGAVFPAGAGVPSLDEIEPPIMQAASESAPAAETDTTQDRTISSILVQVLTAGAPQARNLIQERDELLSAAVPLAERIEAYVAAVAEESREGLREQYRAIREEGRKQEEVCARALLEFGAARAEWGTLKLARDVAKTIVQGAQDKVNRLSRFATDLEIKSAHDALTRARAAFNNAQGQESSALQVMNRLATVSNSESEKLARIATSVDVIKAQLEGRSFRDPETGLKVR